MWNQDLTVGGNPQEEPEARGRKLGIKTQEWPARSQEDPEPGGNAWAEDVTGVDNF